MIRKKNERTSKPDVSSCSASKLGVVYDARMTRHQDPVDPSHPEQPARISRIFEALKEEGLLQLDSVVHFPVNRVNPKDLLSVHTKDWVETCLECVPQDESADAGDGALSLSQLIFFSQRFDSVFMNQASLDCALLSAGATVEVTTRVVKEECRNGVAIVRPPGHHAEAHCAKGFCFFNNVAVACAVAIRSFGLERILVVDWDVHHGNGTQHMFENDPRVLYVSLHRHDHASFYPNSVDGDPRVVGSNKGRGFNVNVAWNGSASGRGGGGFGDADYLYAWEKLVIPLAAQYKPQLTLISAGFDAARGDPLGGCDLTPVGYAHLTKQLMEVTPAGKVVLVLEGGYNLASISSSFAECVRVLKAPTEKEANDAGAAPSEARGGGERGGGAANEKRHYLPAAYGGPLIPSAAARRAVRLTSLHLAPFWKHLELSGRCDRRQESSSSGTCTKQSSGDAIVLAERKRNATKPIFVVKYATKPVLIGPRVSGQAWAMCFNASMFAGRLYRFGRRRHTGPWRQISASQAHAFESEEGFESDDSLGSEDAGGTLNEEEESEEEEEKGKSNKRARGGSENTENEKKKRGSSSFTFALPEGVQLVSSTDSFTPFADGRCGESSASGSSSEDEEAYWAEYFQNSEDESDSNAETPDDLPPKKRRGPSPKKFE